MANNLPTVRLNSKSSLIFGILWLVFVSHFSGSFFASDAVKELESVRNFLEEKGHTNAATDTSSLISAVVCLSYTVSNSTRQTTITEFFWNSSKCISF